MNKLIGKSVAEIEIWEPSGFELPNRSRLYHLEPVGINTPSVECLTSYLSRLASIHHVTLGCLIYKEIKPILPTSYQNGLQGSQIYMCARTLNGLGTMAEDWVNLLETLTLRRDLRFLTMLTWKQVIPQQGLSRYKRAWCPSCYHQWRERKQPIYEPLLWSIDEITICVNHSRRLVHECSHCKSSLPHMAPHHRPGYCSKCWRWLGSTTNEPASLDTEIQEGELEWQTWVVKNVGELIASSQHSLIPERARVAELLTSFAKRTLQQNSHALGLWLQMGGVRAIPWCKGKHLPRLHSLLHICFRVGISLKQFLSGDNFSLDLPIQPNLPSQQYQPRKISEPSNIKKLKGLLETILSREEFPPPSMTAVSKQLDVAYRNLYRLFPDLCSKIAAKHMKYRRSCKLKNIKLACSEVKQIVSMLHADGIIPSRSRVESLMSKSGYLQLQQVRETFIEIRLRLGYTKGM